MPRKWYYRAQKGFFKLRITILDLRLTSIVQPLLSTFLSSLRRDAEGREENYPERLLRKARNDEIESNDGLLTLIQGTKEVN